MNAKPVYFDFMSTTPIDPRVLARMIQVMGVDGDFGNPHAQHAYGKQAALAIEHARQQIADTLVVDPNSLIFTSGATEANNLALLGAARQYQRQGRHIITMRTEHKSVLDACAQLEREGFAITYLTPDHKGLLAPDVLETALRDDTILASIMHVNNETGVIQNIDALGTILRSHGILFHVDAAQSAGKLPINLHQSPVDLMSLSAHKNYGPKGIGALYVRQKPRLRLQAQTYGGGQEHGLRAGTLATHQIVGMGEAFAIANTCRETEQARLLSLRQTLWQGIQHLPGIHLNGHPTQRLAGHLSISFAGQDGADLLHALSGLALSTMSACTAASNQTSYVLRALGLSDALAKSALRITMGRTTSLDDVHRAIQIFCHAAEFFR